MNPSVIPRPAQFLGLAGLIPFAGLAAGTGNYLHSDILFEARLRPDVRIAALTVPQREALAGAALSSLRQRHHPD